MWHNQCEQMSYSQQRRRTLTCKTTKTIRRYIVVLVVCAFTMAYVQLSYMESRYRNMRRNRTTDTSRQISTTLSPDDNQNLVTNNNGLMFNNLSSKSENGNITEFDESKLFGKTLTLAYRENADTNYTAKPLMFLFSSWKYSKEKANVHDAILRLWSAWPSIRTAVFTKDANVTKNAIFAGWETLSHLTVHADCLGPPVLAPMFSVMKNNYKAHFYGYSNADIVFGEGLEKTLKFLHEHDAWRDKPLLIIGRRYNVNFFNDSSIVLNTPSDVKNLTKKGNLVLRSTDYFFTNELFPWQNAPKVSIGRPFVVRSIIGYALKRKYAVIEATKTIESVHLTTEDGNRASWHVKGMKCNQKVLSKNHWSIPTGKGHCECALLETFMENDTIQVRQRKPNKTICK